MKVLLINSESFHAEQKNAIPLGLLSIATYLTHRGHTVKIYDRIVDKGSLKKYLSSFLPDIVGISAIGIKSFPDAFKVSKAVKRSRIPVVWGGQMPSLIPDVILKTGDVDYVVMGEGEITMLALLDAIINKTPLNNVDGLAFLESGSIKINKQRAFADLAHLPVIDWSFVDPQQYVFKNFGSERTLHVYASKGCPGQCTYCYSPHYSQRKWRSRPPEYFLEEIKYLVETHNIDGVFFADDLFSPNKKHLEDLCHKIIESGIQFVWGCDLRADIWQREELQMMYDAGCRNIFFGIESGSEQRQKVIKKGTNLSKTIEVINHCKEIGIITITSFIIGFPDETEEELKETVNFLINLKSDIKLAFFYYPVPNSELYANLVKNKKFIAQNSYKEWLRFTTLTSLGKNFSNVPDKDLKVISAYFMFASIFGKYHDDKTESRVYAKKAFGQTFETFKRGTLNSLVLVFLGAKKFLEVVFYTVMFPATRKKYGLYRGNKNK